MRYWISWWQPGDDPRPLHSPPKTERVLGWWVSGESETHSSICALVQADNEEEAKLAVIVDWPESKDAEWRFLQEKDAKWVPPADRFPPKDWMILRHATSR